MYKLTANIEGTSEYELVLALREIMNKVENGFVGFRDSNEDGHYSFSIDEQAVTA